MKVHNPTEFTLTCSKNGEVWEILPKSTVEFTQEQEVNMEVHPQLLVTEKSVILQDIEE